MTASATTVSPAKGMLRLAAPLILSQIAQVLTGLVDTVMSGQAGSGEQAVVALGVALWIPIFIALITVVQAVSPIVSHHVGAGDGEAVARDAREGLWLAAWLSVLPLLALPWAPDLLIHAGIAAPLAERTGVFLWGIGLGLPAAAVYRAIGAYSVAIGRTRPIMVLSFAGLAINAALNDVLIYGRFGAPALGGAGCGWASGIGMWIALLALASWTALAPAYRPYFLWRDWGRPRLEVQGRLLRLGLPMGGAGLAEAAAFAGVAVLIGRFGTVQIAAHQSALNFSALTFMLPAGIASATSIFVGRALGANDPAAARRAAWTGMALGLSIAAAATLVVVLMRHPIAAVYSSDPAVRALAANLLLVAAFWQLFDAAQVCAGGALRGYQVTLLPMWLMIGAFWVVGIPLGSYLGYHGWPGHAPLEVYGLWIGLVIGLVLVSTGLALTLRRVALGRLHAAAPYAARPASMPS